LSLWLPDRWLTTGSRICVVIASGLAILMIGFILIEALPALRQSGLSRLVGDAAWLASAGRFGVTPLLAASLAVTAGALVIAVPLGVLSALFLEVYAPAMIATGYHRMLELLAGVPSVVTGLWGLSEVVPWINRMQPPGQSLLAGCMVLALMILPVIALTSAMAVRRVIYEQRATALALGMRRDTFLVRIVLPLARRGILSGVVLAFVRAIGETMAVVMVCGNTVQIPSSLFSPVRTLTANIALEMGEASGFHRSALFLTALLLMVVIAATLLMPEDQSASPGGRHA